MRADTEEVWEVVEAEILLGHPEVDDGVDVLPDRVDIRRGPPFSRRTPASSLSPFPHPQIHACGRIPISSVGLRKPEKRKMNDDGRRRFGCPAA
jgi:hypothetical protein